MLILNNTKIKMENLSAHSYTPIVAEAGLPPVKIVNAPDALAEVPPTSSEQIAEPTQQGLMNSVREAGYRATAGIYANTARFIDSNGERSSLRRKLAIGGAAMVAYMGYKYGIDHHHTAASLAHDIGDRFTKNATDIDGNGRHVEMVNHMTGDIGDFIG